MANVTNIKYDKYEEGLYIFVSTDGIAMWGMKIL